MRVFVLLMVLLLGGCLGMPERVTPVEAFQVERYLGPWYEIARLDHSFERGMVDVTAFYQWRSDGGISVLNRGFLPDSGQWKSAQGRAYFVEEPDRGYLKVSFFGPFYGSYVIFWLDEEYQHAFVCGPNLSYLWLLSRSRQVPPSVLADFKRRAKSMGFDTGALIYPVQTVPAVIQ